MAANSASPGTDDHPAPDKPTARYLTYPLTCRPRPYSASSETVRAAHTGLPAMPVAGRGRGPDAEGARVNKADASSLTQRWAAPGAGDEDGDVALWGMARS